MSARDHQMNDVREQRHLEEVSDMKAWIDLQEQRISGQNNLIDIQEKEIEILREQNAGKVKLLALRDKQLSILDKQLANQTKVKDGQVATTTALKAQLSEAQGGKMQANAENAGLREEVENLRRQLKEEKSTGQTKEWYRKKYEDATRSQASLEESQAQILKDNQALTKELENNNIETLDLKADVETYKERIRKLELESEAQQAGEKIREELHGVRGQLNHFQVKYQEAQEWNVHVETELQNLGVKPQELHQAFIKQRDMEKATDLAAKQTIDTLDATEADNPDTTEAGPSDATDLESLLEQPALGQPAQTTTLTRASYYPQIEDDISRTYNQGALSLAISQSMSKDQAVPTDPFPPPPRATPVEVAQVLTEIPYAKAPKRNKRKKGKRAKGVEEQES